MNNEHRFICSFEKQDYENKVRKIAEEYGFNLKSFDDTIGIDGSENGDSDPIDRLVEMAQKILKCVDIPQIIYPKAPGSFSTGEINYYSIPCWGSITCLYNKDTLACAMEFQFGEENSTEEIIRGIVEQELEQLEINIENKKKEENG